MGQEMESGWWEYLNLKGLDACVSVGKTSFVKVEQIVIAYSNISSILTNILRSMTNPIQLPLLVILPLS